MNIYSDTTPQVHDEVPNFLDWVLERDYGVQS